MKFFKTFIKTILFPFVLIIGYIYFLITKKTIPISYAAFRFLFVKTNGKINDFFSSLISKKENNNLTTINGILGELNAKQIDDIIKGIQKDGFFVFDQKIDEETINSLMKFALETKTKTIDIHQNGVKYLPEKILFNPEKPLSPRYQFEGIDVAQNPTARKIFFDPTFRILARKYLKCEPILDIVTMWWSVPFGNKATAQSAQMYHFDMDRFKFLKFFFYITDVHTNNGPHCYIKGSHKSLPNEILSDRRLTDEELATIYSIEDMIEFTGKKGSVLAVDTRGLHKGKPLIEGTRLLFQIQFSNSLFGASYEITPIQNKTLEEEKTILENPRTYQLFK